MTMNYYNGLCIRKWGGPKVDRLGLRKWVIPKVDESTMSPKDGLGLMSWTLT